MSFNHKEIEARCKYKWTNEKTYRSDNASDKPKYYVLDMFPYPSGAGLHVGHPLGYIASDIISRFKRQQGYNVLHPMGFDAFGLPAEQYAIQTGVHPKDSTDVNIKKYRSQLDNIGFDYDWDREVRTCEPNYYRWTQWIFLQLFHSYYDRNLNKARPLTELIKSFEENGNEMHTCPGNEDLKFTAEEWKNYTEAERHEILTQYRLAYCGCGDVNWCEALGTVLANDEVVNGVSERGGYPVVKKNLRQWYLRITEYADRLLEGLETISFSESMKEMQSNWIGKSSGANINFKIDRSHPSLSLKVYTTRPDTIFGADFMVIAPEHPEIQRFITEDQSKEVQEYLDYVQSRSERERIAEKKISGVFTGSYAIHPFSDRKIPVWTSEYVLAGYGTGAIMAVPCCDERDFKFASHFNIPITNIVGDKFTGDAAIDTKDAALHNSDFLDGVIMKDAIELVIEKLEESGIGTRKVNFKLRDAAFSRQRYWGEPFPVRWVEGIPVTLDESDLPLELPYVASYKPGPEGEGPLANVEEWISQKFETNTMPGYAGSSWYFLRYMDPHNDREFCSREASQYWNQVDLYIGGTEHAVGHLLYSRMWTKVLHDLGHISFDEPFKKLVNQGMIQGSSRFVYRIRGTERFVSAGLKDQYETDPIHVDVNMVDGLLLDIEAFMTFKNGEFSNAEMILEEGKYICGTEVEKMSKSKYNTVNPDDIVERYGADTFRMYEMFLGPIEQSKPWDTKGIDGVWKFLRKLWGLYHDENDQWIVTEEMATKAENKALHTAIKKLNQDIEKMSMNTCISALMICVNELRDLNCNKKAILKPLVSLIAPFAPFISEELWTKLGESGSVHTSSYPMVEEKYLEEDEVNYPVSINGKKRTEITLPKDMDKSEIEKIVLELEVTRKWMEGKEAKKVIIVPGRMVNIVI
jgi:leucyl-tRNA synthetase